MARMSLIQYLYYQTRKLPEVDSYRTDLTDSVIIVTGANVGLGLEAARHLARMKPSKLILACRNTTTGSAAARQIAETTGCETVECWALDLASFESVVSFVDRFEVEGGGKLDILIENAGMSTPQYTTTEDGWETTLKVNHIGTAHLALRLLPYLLKAPAADPLPRLVVVTSEIHYWVYGRKDLDAPNILERLNSAEHCKEFGVMSLRYGATKLFNIFFVRYLASRLRSSSGLAINAVNPGLCHSHLTRNMEGPGIWLLKYMLARSTETGSRTLVHAALSPELQGVTGEYLNACEVNEPSDFVISEEGQAIQSKIWEETIEVLSKADPEIALIVERHLS